MPPPLHALHPHLLTGCGEATRASSFARNALAGIVVRNGIILVDFIRNAVARGQSARDAVFEAGAVRFRPIFLTAGAALLGTWPITLDPIFSGLAWSIIFGLFVSTAFTLLIIPTVYMLIYGKQTGGAKTEETI